MTKKKRVTKAPKIVVAAPTTVVSDPFDVDPAETAETVTVAPKKTGFGVSNLPRGPDGKPLPRTKAQEESERGEPESLAAAAQEAFLALGGRRWLKKRAKQFPKEFMSLLARTAAEDGVTGGMTYIAVPIPVEVREIHGGGALEPVATPDPFM